MSKRLQVLLDEREFDELKATAQRHGVTVSDWVRGVIRDAGRREPGADRERKLEALRAAARHSFPAPDIEQMNAEIAMGYGPLPE